MVFTVTLNPTLDYYMNVEKLRYDDINRSYEEKLCYGGKGINVSVILSRLGVDNTALGFVAGFTGKKLEEMLENDSVHCDFNTLEEGNTRINVKIRSDVELDVNAQGPAISPEDVEKLMKKLEKLKQGDFLVLAGSVPKTLPRDIYENILQRLDGRGINFVVDTTGELLLNVLKYKPFLVKPNHHELGDFFGKVVETDEEVEYYAKKLQQLGARNVLVSRSKKGAFLLDENGEAYTIGNAEGKLVNSVGCGDSMVAGFVAGYKQKQNYSHALILGSACGNATAFSQELAERQEIERVYDEMKNLIRR